MTPRSTKGYWQPDDAHLDVPDLHSFDDSGGRCALSSGKLVYEHELTLDERAEAIEAMEREINDIIWNAP